MKQLTIKNFLPSLLTSLLFSLLTTQIFAAEQALCTYQPTSIINKDTFSVDGKTHLQADSVKADEKNISRFTGNVVIQQKDKRIETDQAEYQKKTERIEAKGNVHFITPNIEIKSEDASFNLKSEQAVLNNAQYQSMTSRAHGEAAKIEIKDSNTTILNDATYTTCEPGQTDWLLSASELILDNENHQGHASHVVLRFKDVPFFYFPYFRFPLGEERLSGFMFPYLGSSSKHGTEIRTPYYWNIHPQLDATITPWYMSKRGTLLHSEFRYLTENNSGSFTGEYLADDKIFNDDRKRWQWKHQSKPGLGWQAKAEYNYVSDNSYNIDFSDNLKSTSATYLIRSGEISYNIPNWLLNIKAENHQILSGAEPYKRLPQITFNSRYALKDNALNYALETEAVRFDHENSSKVIGERIHLKSSISYPLKSAAGFIESKLSVQYTTYNLQQTGGKTQLSRTIPTLSINSGLFFDRESQFFNRGYTQTLEPQLYYVYVPFKNQNDLPVFDTSAYSFNVNQSFTDYRFNGIDRIGDDNRLTAALATRFLDQENGKEVFMARIGQIYYFTDRKVQLPSAAVNTNTRSNIIAELKTQLSNWNFSSQAEWNAESKEMISNSTQLGYQHKKFNFSLAHRLQLNQIETGEVKINWNINSRWKVNTTHLYDIRNDHVIERLVGLDFESCCWGLKISGKERYLTNTEIDRGIYLELVLKGLGGISFKHRP